MYPAPSSSKQEAIYVAVVHCFPDGCPSLPEAGCNSYRRGLCYGKQTARMCGSPYSSAGSTVASRVGNPRDGRLACSTGARANILRASRMQCKEYEHSDLVEQLQRHGPHRPVRAWALVQSWVAKIATMTAAVLASLFPPTQLRPILAGPKPHCSPAHAMLVSLMRCPLPPLPSLWHLEAMSRFRCSGNLVRNWAC